ncbi:hypothetical protein RI129_009379 [Pyrocoelia pectoralis]|uniref:Major facilitator superfamily (MFS) profile domain-containing protein n=1 Tax=Pyrocoelia pectoralis TaxID=417401 RepID=A0AAN7ZEU6_9COLE
MKLSRSRLFAVFRQFLATVCLGPILLGANSSWTSPVLPQLENSTANFTITHGQGSWVGSMLAVGVLITAVPSGYLADRYGMKKCVMVVSVLPTILFAVIIYFTRNFYWLCFGRILTGASVGAVSVLGPMYLCEISDVTLRGTLNSFFECLVFVGIFLVSVCGAYVNYITLTLIIGALAFTCGAIFLFMPENPTYLMSLKKYSEAGDVLVFYRGDNINVDELLKEIQGDMDEKSKRWGSVKKVLMSKGALRGLIACVGLTIFQESSGVDAFVVYTVQIFQTAGTTIDAYRSAMIIAAVQVISTAMTIFIVEKVRRRLLLFISTIGSCLALGCMGAYFHMKELDISFNGLNFIPLVSFTIFSLSFALGLGPVLWLLNGELFSHEIKGVANGIIITSSWICVFIVLKTFPIAMVDLGPHYTFYFSSMCMVACVIFIKFFVPETKGKTLEEIQKELNL